MPTPFASGSKSSNISHMITSSLIPITKESDLFSRASARNPNAPSEDPTWSKISSRRLERRTSQHQTMTVEKDEVLNLLVLNQGDKGLRKTVENSHGRVSRANHGFGENKMTELKDSGAVHDTSAQPLRPCFHGPQAVLCRAKQIKRTLNNKTADRVTESIERDYLAEALTRAEDWEVAELSKRSYHTTAYQLKSLEKILPATWEEFSRKCGKPGIRKHHQFRKAYPTKAEDETF